MKKISIVAFVVAAALAGCHKKNNTTTPAGGGDMGSGSATMAPPAGGSGDMGSGGSGRRWQRLGDVKSRQAAFGLLRCDQTRASSSVRAFLFARSIAGSTEIAAMEKW